MIESDFALFKPFDVLMEGLKSSVISTGSRMSSSNFRPQRVQSFGAAASGVVKGSLQQWLLLCPH